MNKTNYRIRHWQFVVGIIALVIALVATDTIWAQGAGPATPPADAHETTSQSMLGFITAGGVIGYVIIALSIAGLALVVDSFVRLKADKLIPAALVEQTLQMAQRRRFGELLGLCKTSDTVLGRIVGNSLSDGELGLDAVREGVQHHGQHEITRLQQRVGYLGLIAAVAPMLGLLGTVIGMINSFNVLGAAKGAARPDELAVGISQALVTTCMGLILAVPMIFFHFYFRERVTQIGQQAAATCEKLVRIMAVQLGARQRERDEHQGADGKGADATE